MAAYKKTEPNDVVNEMHSVFGSEVANLPRDLETYYQRYFTTRSKVTNYAAGYEAVFTSRLNQVKIYEAQLSTLKAVVDAEKASLATRSAQLQADRATLDGLRSSGRTNEYNSRVAAFNQEVESYNTAVAQLKSHIRTYNYTVDLHNRLAEEIRSLYSSLETGLATQAAQ